jgi:hypothetical protein
MAIARAARAAKLATGQSAAPEGLATTASFIPPVPEPANDEDLAVRAATQAVAREIAATPVPDSNIPPELLKTNNERVAEQQAADAELRIRAARQRAAAGVPDPIESVKVRVTKQGDGKISMGKHVPGIGEAYYEWKEEFSIPEPIAKALEDRFLVEIL